jgi:hypothetical protein
MDSMHGFPRKRKGHDYMFVVVDMFSDMCIIIPCKNTIKGQYATNMFFENVWMHFEIPRSITSYRDIIFLSSFWTTPSKKMDTKLKISTNRWVYRSSEQEIGSNFEGLQLESLKDLG